MTLKSSLRGSFSNNLNESFIEVILKNEVMVHTDVYSYDGFSIIVEFGSALGLWLGLSALYIFNSILDYFIVFQSKLGSSKNRVQIIGNTFNE